jgi:prepilin-type N-terminal cleavage/methylation domain-containing protein
MMRTRRLKTRVRGEPGGFTLVEILLAVLIIALIGSVGVGVSVARYKKIKVEKAARDFMFAARYARMTAIERQTPCIIELDTAGSVFAVVTYGVDAETGQTGTIPVVGTYFKRPVEFGGDVMFEEVRVAPLGQSWAQQEDEEQAIVFLPNGTAHAALVQIGDGTTHYTASISGATGRTRLHAGTADGIGSPTMDLDED